MNQRDYLKLFRIEENQKSLIKDLISEGYFNNLEDLNSYIRAAGGRLK